MKNLRGFTLIELLVLVAVIAILASIAIPNFSATIKGDRDISQVNTLLSALDLARSEAVKSAANVQICPTLDDINCSGGAWNSGWMVLYVTPPPGAHTLVRSLPALAGGNTLTTAPAATSVIFNSSGMASTATNFKLCDTRGPNYARSVNLNATGRAEAAPNVGYQVDGTVITTCP